MLWLKMNDLGLWGVGLYKVWFESKINTEKKPVTGRGGKMKKGTEWSTFSPDD